MILAAVFPPDVPAHWSTYFAVGDTDAAVATITGAGGAVMREPWDSPYGRMAVVSDDQGADVLADGNAHRGQRLSPGQSAGNGWVRARPPGSWSPPP